MSKWISKYNGNIVSGNLDDNSVSFRFNTESKMLYLSYPELLSAEMELYVNDDSITEQWQICAFIENELAVRLRDVPDKQNSALFH
ncbi:hypothetical protein ABT56_19200 [Photobacterium aquae]|uniref:Uncharacterized protein n=1 Tax=Photobacterium aquae TaxID=1195763 RepID=A0A0J1GVA7_9GAMM|nr:hypothetical protein [Photobacterium aquae]KLV03556.1 hypothetical protein ABT56_19200 [Photobacterium aquae]